MATRRDARAGERGLSLIEALVIITVTALLAMVLLPLASGAAGRNFALAERSLDGGDAANAEMQVRTLLQGVTQGESFDGHTDMVTFYPSLAATTACAPAGTPQAVRLRVVRGDDRSQLLCEAGDRRVELLRWRDGAGGFSYSADGQVWRSAWSEQAARSGAAPVTHNAPLVRFEIANAAGAGVIWIERAGWTEATLLEVERSGVGAGGP
jgi:type II secretory pathway pseudopilin PulG